jgi:hypothetical protein
VVPDYHTKALNDILGKIVGGPNMAATISRAANAKAAIAEQLRIAVLTEVPEFATSRNPDLLPELTRHGMQHVDEILRLLAGGQLGALEFVHEHARRRAEQHFPLVATLHAYRSGHKVVSRCLREAALSVVSAPADAQTLTVALADFCIEYTDAISTAFAATYSAHKLLLAEVAGDQRAQLLQILLEGHDEADLDTARLLRDQGLLDQRQSFCVALARSVDPAEMLNAPRARRLVDAIETIVTATSARHIIDLHANKVTMVFAELRRDSGWTAPRSSLARRVSTALLAVGNAALIGVSNDVPSTVHIPAAYREAATALELANVTHRVVQFADVPLQRLLLHYGGAEFRRVLPSWSTDLHAADQRASGALLATLRAYANADMNILSAAQVLGVHPNTIYARLQRVLDISGLQARSYGALTELLIVAECVDNSTVTAPVVGSRGQPSRT